jgi:predicted metal-dependent peptidase
MESFEDFNLMLWTFDTKVYGYKEFTRENLDEILEYDPKGGGGTDFSCNWVFMQENEIEPKRFIMFTDGFDNGDQGKSFEDYTETLFIVHGHNAPTMSHGLTVAYDE